MILELSRKCNIVVSAKQVWYCGFFHDFRTVPQVWYCGFFHDFRTVPQVWYCGFFHDFRTRKCGIVISFMILVPHVW